MYTSLLLLFLDLFDTVDFPQKERKHLRMVEHYYLHSYLLELRQVMMSTIAAITHTAFAGSIAAVSRPAENATAAVQRLRHFIIITLYILLRSSGNVTVEIRRLI